MSIDRGISDAAEIDEVGRLGLRPGLLNRRSFLFGSAVGFSALGLAGCATSEGYTEAAKLYGPVPDEPFPIPAVDVSKINPKYYRRTVRYEPRNRPVQLSSIPEITMFTASKGTETPPGMAPMSAAPGSLER